MKQKTIKRPYGPLTRYGYLFICFVIVFGMSCSSSGTNLLYMMLALALCAIPINGFVAWLCVWRVSVQRDFPSVVTAGNLIELKWKVTNKGWLFPAIGIEIRDIEERLSQFVYVDRLERKDERTVSCDVAFPSRGYYTYNSMWLNTSFPFGLTQRYYKGEKETVTVLALPPVVNASKMRQLVSIICENRTSGIKGFGQEFYGLRDYEQGDPLNRVHWRSMAKRGHPVVKEFETDEVHKAVLILEYVENNLLFELMVIACASLASTLIDSGWSILFPVKGNKQIYLNGKYALQRIMEVLAVIQKEDVRQEQYVRYSDDDGIEIRITEQTDDSVDGDCVRLGING
ncbi:MAG: DUF58 domain-containing protein, partial [Candidatus Sumerlaeales bacterium]|nr:DUF58 domain-containing protein [Candidatus Sumerlaeales bacterium]